MRKVLLLLLAPAFLLTSCRNEDDPTGPGSGTNSGPKTGSTFTYDYEVRGQENEIIDEGSTVQTLVKANTSAYGRSNVWIYVDNENDTNWYAKSSNGDVATYIDLASAETIGLGQAFWINFPTSGGPGEDRVLAEQEVEYHGVPAVLRATLNSEFGGNEQITIGTKTYPVKVASSTIELEVLVGGQVVNTGVLVDGSFWWIPELNASAGTQQMIEGENTYFFAQELVQVNVK